MAGESTDTLLAGHEVARGGHRDSAELVDAAAALAVAQLAAWRPDTGPEEVPDFENHPHIQYGPTAGPYYPMTHRII